MKFIICLIIFQKSSKPENLLALVPKKTVLNSIEYSNHAQYAIQWKEHTNSKSEIVYSSEIPDPTIITFSKHNIIQRPIKEPNKLHLRKKTTREIKVPEGLPITLRKITTTTPRVKMLKMPRRKQNKRQRATIDTLSYRNPVYVLNPQKQKVA